MRPGQTAPECQRAAKQAYDPDTRFNEAGADCPGMLSCSFHWTWRQGCFNEAGADCPGMHWRKPPRKKRGEGASMRPGQTAPECAALAGIRVARLGVLQ